MGFTALLIGCGGGGGGGSGEGDIASSSLEATPATIEVGGTQKVTIHLSNVTQNLAVKIRYPAALQYVSGSAYFINGNDTVATNPAYDLSEVPEDSSSSSSAGNGSSAAATATPTPTATATAKASGSSSSKAEVVYEKRYLVFFITRDAFGTDPNGTLTFTIRAKNVQEDGKVELDVDLDDPSINNDDEFSVTNPLFEKEQAVDVRVRN